MAPKSKTSVPPSTNAAVVIAAIIKKSQPLTKKLSDLKVKTKEDYETGAKILHQLKIYRADAVVEEKKFTDPANQIIKAAREHFKPFRDMVDRLEEDTKMKMKLFLEQQDERKEKLHSQLENGQIKKVDTMLRKEAELTVDNTNAKVRTVKVVQITNARLIPAAYMVPNMVAIKAALLNGKSVPGCELVDDKIIAV